jgi:L-seryl-tRNA(Ser) seleniumtransferase
MADTRRRLPSVDAMLRSGPGTRASRVLGRALVKRTLTATLDEIRERVAAGEEPPIADEILAAAVARARVVAFGLTPVINATGVVLHTNLGRAPLAPAAVRAVTTAACGADGGRGRRRSSLRSPTPRMPSW